MTSINSVRKRKVEEMIKVSKMDVGIDDNLICATGIPETGAYLRSQLFQNRRHQFHRSLNPNRLE